VLTTWKWHSVSGLLYWNVACREMIMFWLILTTTLLIYKDLILYLP
jgi:hypothetical protein